MTQDFLAVLAITMVGVGAGLSFGTGIGLIASGGLLLSVVCFDRALQARAPR